MSAEINVGVAANDNLISVADDLTKKTVITQWLAKHNLFTREMEADLFMAGAVAGKDVKYVDLKIDANSSTVHYILYVSPWTYWQYRLYAAASSASGVLKFILYPILKLFRHAKDPAIYLNRFVAMYLGVQWKSTVVVDNIRKVNQNE